MIVHKSFTRTNVGVLSVLPCVKVFRHIVTKRIKPEFVLLCKFNCFDGFQTIIWDYLVNYSHSPWNCLVVPNESLSHLSGRNYHIMWLEIFLRTWTFQERSPQLVLEFFYLFRHHEAITSSGLVSQDVPLGTAAITKPTSTETLAEHEVSNGSK